MKKTLFIFGATLIASTVFTSCSKEDSTHKKYYGVEPINSGTPKEAYYAFFGGIMAIIFGILWLLKKMKTKK